MKLKHALLLTIVFCLVISLTACSGALTPKDAVKSLFSALEEYDIEKLKEILTEFPNADDCAITYDPFSDKPYVLLYQKAYKDQLKYEILSINEASGTEATIKLKVNHPDLKSAYSTALYTSMAMIFSDEKLFNEIIENEDMEISNYVPNQMQNMVAQGNVEMIETEFTLQLTKKDNQWVIVTDEQLKNLISSNLFLIASNKENALGDLAGAAED